jgi:hypothetical protein
MRLNSQKEQISYSHVRAIASGAGYGMEIKDVVLDGEGVDLTINAPGSLGGRRNVRVDAQVKCTSDTSIFSGGVIKYSLPVKNYNTLRDTNSYCLQYLFLTCVPEHVGDYVRAYSDKIVLRNCT